MAVFTVSFSPREPLALKTLRPALVPTRRNQDDQLKAMSFPRLRDAPCSLCNFQRRQVFARNFGQRITLAALSLVQKTTGLRAQKIFTYANGDDPYRIRYPSLDRRGL
jgi:hypothetical protein